jgi:SAM-dependent methyltransferase
MAAQAWARSGVRSLPPPIRDRVRALYHALRTPKRPPDPQVRYSADVADRDSLFEYLSDTDVFGEAHQECLGYLNDAIERFRITLSLVDQILSKGRVLELGSNPYFITRLLLRRGLDVTSANWFGDPALGPRSVQVVSGTRTGERHVFEFDHFNVESDTFPYPDGEFDLVLCCEILEHLPHDPVHMLAEIHRVLRRDTGRLLLTTPNPVRVDNLSRMLRGDNVYEELSGYGAYGRHNREYTTAELDKLLQECGYADVRVFAMDIHPHDLSPEVKWSGANLTGRGDNIFAVGRAEGEPRWPYPGWLYASRHALARRVRPDVRMGYNDALQTAGFHELEHQAGVPFRWTGRSPNRAQVSAQGDGSLMLRVEGYAPPSSAGAGITVTAELDGNKTSWHVACDGSRFSLSAPVEVARGDHDVRIGTDRTWRPCDVSSTGDSRELGVRVTRIALES